MCCADYIGISITLLEILIALAVIVGGFLGYNQLKEIKGNIISEELPRQVKKFMESKAGKALLDELSSEQLTSKVEEKSVEEMEEKE